MYKRVLKVVEHISNTPQNTYDVFIDGQKIEGVTCVEIVAESSDRPLKKAKITFKPTEVEWITKAAEEPS